MVWNRARRALAALLAAALALTLCGCAFGALEGAPLRSPPAGADQQALHDAVRVYLGEAAQLKYPMSEGSSSPYFLWDADGDGTQELVVLYQNTAKSKNVQLALLRQDAAGRWYAAHMDVEGAAGDVDGLQALRLADGQEYLAAGYQDSTGQDWTLCLYRWDSGALHEAARLTCQQYVALSPAVDGSCRIAAVQAGNYGQLQLHVYGAPDGQGALAEVSSTALDTRFVRCSYLAAGCPPQGETTLVLDCTSAEGTCLAEVLSWQGERFVRCFTQDAANIPNFTARPFAGLPPADVQGDGSVEVPRVEGQALGGAGGRFYFVGWYDITFADTQLCGCGLADASAGYQLLLPADWNNRVMLQWEGGVWTLRTIDDGALLLTLASSDSRPAGDYQLLGQLGTQRLYVRFEPAVAAEQRAQILAGLRLLYV